MGCFVCMYCFVVMVISLYLLFIRLYDDSRDNRMFDRSEIIVFDRKVERYDRREDRFMDFRDNRIDRSFGDRRDRDNFSRDSRLERRSTERFERLVIVKDVVRNEIVIVFIGKGIRVMFYFVYIFRERDRSNVRDDRRDSF